MNSSPKTLMTALLMAVAASAFAADPAKIGSVDKPGLGISEDVKTGGNPAKPGRAVTQKKQSGQSKETPKSKQKR